MRIGYLVNQYPKVSHSFIRREILAFESRGHEIARYSVRPCPDNLVDPADLRERDMTLVLLSGTVLLFAVDLLSALVEAPLAWLHTLAFALLLSHRSEAGLFKHLVYFLEACRLKRWCRRDGVGHLHCHFGTNATTVAMLSENLGGPKYSFTVHGQEEFDKPGAIKLPEKIRRSTFVAGISYYGRAQLYRWVEPEYWPRIQVVRCGVDKTFLGAELTPVPDVRRLVCIGRLSHEKGQPLLLDAMKLLADAGVCFDLVLVGDGPMRGTLEKIIADYGLTDRVRITGYLSSERVRDELKASRALVLSSFAEGLPVVLMEAFAVGRPVVSTTIAAVPELVEQGKSGWLVAAGSAVSLAEGIRAALDAPAEQLTAMGRAGFEKVRSQHDAQAEADKLGELFSQVLEKGEVRVEQRLGAGPVGAGSLGAAPPVNTTGAMGVGLAVTP